MSEEPWPVIEYDDGYPEDEEFVFWKQATREPDMSFNKAADWLLSELPRAAKHMPCFCEVKDAIDSMGRPCRLIDFSTGGWSGAESIIALISRRYDMNHFMLSWRRGGHYVFEIPCRFLPAEAH